MTEFSDRPFVAGTLRGHRSFAVDKLGRLTGVSHQVVWTPGLNEAVCRYSQNSVTLSLYNDYWTRVMLGGPISTTVSPGGIISSTVALDPGFSETEAARTKAKQEAEDRRKDPSHIATLGCECGFYAYFDEGSNPYHTKGETLRGLVEAQGRLTVGNRGFRAEKAAIVALIEPGKRAMSGKAGQRIALVKRNYPEIPFFASRDEALAAFPLIAPPIPAPSDDPDFWTRSA